MYIKNRHSQLRFTDFQQPIGLKMNPENRWIKKAEAIPWAEIEEREEESNQTNDQKYYSNIFSFFSAFLRVNKNNFIFIWRCFTAACISQQFLFQGSSKHLSFCDHGTK